MSAVEVGRVSRSTQRAARRATHSRPAAMQEALFEVRIRPERRYFRQMLEALTRSGFGLDPAPGGALAAESIVARLFGTCWASDPVARDGSAEETFGLGLVDFTRQRRSPTSLALLRALAVIAPILQVRAAAAAAADALAAAGVPEPPWSPPVGAVIPGRCWSFDDVYGDVSTVICEFGYGTDLRTADRHAVAVQVDHALLSVAADTVLLDDVDPVIRELGYQAKRDAPMHTLRQVDPAWARALLLRAFARTDLIQGVSVGADFAHARALALARLAVLPDVAHAMPAVPEPTREQQQSLVADFLASPEAAALPEHEHAERVAALIVEYGAARDPDQPGRVGPAKWDLFFDWLAGRGEDAITLDVLAPVARAWSVWAGRRMRLPALAREELAGVLDCLLDDLVAHPRRPAPAGSG